MVKRIGILGGISHESTIKYYELLHQKYYQQANNYYYPEIIIYSLNFQQFTDLENSGNKIRYVEYILQGINALENAGANFIILAANSPHAVFGELEKNSRVPLISIVEVTALKAKNQNMKKLLLLGIKFTMQSSFYPDVFNKYSIRIIVPSEKEQNEINTIIFDELVLHIFKESSKRKIIKIINKYKVDGVILGCTELPLLLKQEDVSIKLLNALEIHVDAALDFTLSKREI